MSFYKKLSSIICTPLPWYKIILILVFRLILRFINIIGQVFDCFFYYNYKKQKNVNPVFLIGHPRSGTTFLHRFLLEINDHYRGMYLWEMIFSSLFYRKLAKPILPYLDRISKKKLYNPQIHKTGLLEAETDDIALFFKSFDGLFFWLYFRAFSKFENLEQLSCDLTHYSNIDKTLFNLRKLHTKNLFSEKKLEMKMFSKSFSLIISINQVIRQFPDSKIILLMRDPLEVIPSSMSLMKGLLEKLFNFESLPQEKRDIFYHNIYLSSLFFFQSLHNVLHQTDDLSGNLIAIYYKQIKYDFTNTMNLLFDFLDIEKTEEVILKLSEQEKNQKSYKSLHNYSLEDFGLTESKIREDFKFIYDSYPV